MKDEAYAHAVRLLEARIVQLETELERVRGERDRLIGREQGAEYAPGVAAPLAKVDTLIPPAASEAVAKLLEAAKAAHGCMLSPRSGVAIQLAGAIATIESLGRFVRGRWVL